MGDLEPTQKMPKTKTPFMEPSASVYVKTYAGLPSSILVAPDVTILIPDVCLVISRFNVPDAALIDNPTNR